MSIETVAASPETAAEIAERGLLLLATVGSTAHGVALEGTDDRDEMGVCIEPPSHVIGLRRFEQHVFRTKPEGVPSEAGDLDKVVYSLRKWCSLALKGNPTVLLLLFAPPSLSSETGEALRELAPAFAARNAGNAFLGYLEAQRQRLTGERGQKNVKRPELVDEHGYDTKYAMHMLRLGMQGMEYLVTGRISLPMPNGDRDYLLSVRRGEIPLEDVLSTTAICESVLKRLLDESPLPAQPDRCRVNEFLVRSYQRFWKENGWLD